MKTPVEAQDVIHYLKDFHINSICETKFSDLLESFADEDIELFESIQAKMHKIQGEAIELEQLMRKARRLNNETKKGN